MSWFDWFVHKPQTLSRTLEKAFSALYTIYTVFIHIYSISYIFQINKTWNWLRISPRKTKTIVYKMGFPLENSKQKTTSNTPREITGESAKKKTFYILYNTNCRGKIPYHIYYVSYGSFLKMGVPLNHHPFPDGIFLKNQPAIGAPPWLWKPNHHQLSTASSHLQLRSNL